MARKYLPPSTAKAKGINVPAPAPLEPVQPPAPAPDEDETPKVEVPAESETRPVLEAFAVEHAGLTEEEAAGFPNKEKLHAAIVAAVDTPNS